MITIFPKAPFDFHKMMKRQQGVGHELYRFEEDRMIRTIRVNGIVYYVELWSVGTIDQPELKARTVPEVKDDKEKSAVERHLSRMISGDVDLIPFYEHIAHDRHLKRLRTPFHGLKIMLESDLFECMAKTIISQQLNLSFAAELTRRLIGITTSPFIHHGREYPVFPSAEQVASLSYEQLRELQFSMRKAEYLIDFARHVVNGSIDLDSLEQMENNEIIARLTRFRGIGRWTAECFLLFGMGRLDLLPAADIGLRNGVKKLYGLSVQPSEDEVRRIGANWTPWSSYVTFYLWEFLNQSD
jgi:DNA-3-methyladenine glycosylase II